MGLVCTPGVANETLTHWYSSCTNTRNQYEITARNDDDDDEADAGGTDGQPS